MLEPLKSARRYAARLIRRTGGSQRPRGVHRADDQVSVRRDLLLDHCNVLGGGHRGRSGGEDERERERDF